MERSVKTLSADGQIPEPPKIEPYGILTFSTVQDIYNDHAQNDQELSEQAKDTLYQYLKHKYYWEQKDKGIGEQFKKTIQMLEQMEVLQ